jgi:hypothetical protein
VAEKWREWGNLKPFGASAFLPEKTSSIPRKPDTWNRDEAQYQLVGLAKRAGPFHITENTFFLSLSFFFLDDPSPFFFLKT